MPREVPVCKGSIVGEGTRHGRSMQKSRPGKFHVRGGTTAMGRPLGGKGTWRGRSTEGRSLSRWRFMAGKSKSLSEFWSFGPSLVFVKLDI